MDDDSYQDADNLFNWFKRNKAGLTLHQKELIISLYHCFRCRTMTYKQLELLRSFKESHVEAVNFFGDFNE